MIEHIVATPAARALVAELRARHGDILFYLSHGCCDGSTPMCLARGELALNSEDVQLGQIDGVPFHASREQRDYLAHLQLTLDAAPGDAGSFSLEDGSGQHFTLTLRPWRDDELQDLRQPAAQAPD